MSLLHLLLPPQAHSNSQQDQVLTVTLGRIYPCYTFYVP
ncbi:hypothetical protein IFVP5_C1370109 [Vibrio parahaemolyticus]